MKSLEDIKQDMGELYEDLKSGKIELKLASELANVAGKFLKAEAIILAKEVFLAQSDKTNIVKSLPDKKKAA